MPSQIKILNKKADYNPNHPVNVTYMGRLRRITTIKYPHAPNTVNMDKDHYMLVDTGEVKKKKHANDRSENIAGIKRSLGTVRDLIDCNCTDAKKCRWITLTYRPMPDGSPMTDTAKLQHDWDVFLKRFKRYSKANGVTPPEYISVAEPQGSGAWHMHVIFIYQDTAPYLPSKDVEEMWGQGFVKVKAVRNSDNIGSYFAAYLTDISFDDYYDDDTTVLDHIELTDRIVMDENGNRVKKKFIKGGRLHYYPVGFNCFRHSRGLKYPKTVKMTNDDASISIRSECELVYRSDIEIVTSDRQKHCNTITKEIYRKD